MRIKQGADMANVWGWIKAHKIWTGVIAFILIAVFAGGGQNPAPSTSSDTNRVATPKYELIGEYGQGGRIYLISPEDATEKKLTSIGKELDKKFGSDAFARIGIFIDRDQAKIATDPLKAAGLEGEAGDAYDRAYVAQFNINKDTGLKQFVIYLQGLDGPQKEIKL